MSTNELGGRILKKSFLPNEIIAFGESQLLGLDLSDLKTKVRHDLSVLFPSSSITKKSHNKSSKGKGIFCESSNATTFFCLSNSTFGTLNVLDRRTFPGSMKLASPFKLFSAHKSERTTSTSDIQASSSPFVGAQGATRTLNPCGSGF